MSAKPTDAPAGGRGAVRETLRHISDQTGIVRGLRVLTRVNQEQGFDCPGCAWPEPEDRSVLEFCEQGAKHIAHEATRQRITREFFAEWPISKLLQQSDYWLEQQGRLTEPMIRRSGSDRYTSISWEDAFARVAEALGGLDSPNQAVFYTSGRTSNEAAFLYQLFVRQYGTNNLPDCSNMCHESSGTGLSEVLGAGKGTVSLEDFRLADAIFILGQNPGTNHPRMMSELVAAKRRGCRIIAANPLRERALVSFAHPKEVTALLGRGTAIADLFLQVRVGGDVALLKGIMKEVLHAEDETPGSVLDGEFIRTLTSGFESFREALARTRWEDLVEQSGVSRAEMQKAAEIYVGAERVIVCWAMGLTQHRHAVANVQEIVNLLLLRGNLGKPGAGACPVRGHSNVQGDRTMGIWERPKPEFLRRLGEEFGFEPPREHGFNTVAAIRAMHEGRARVFFAMGGNFVSATPDTAYTEAALRRCRLTVYVSTKLNRSHLVTGEEAIILPCLGRTERDVQTCGEQFVTVEDSMSIVHRSRGRLEPASSTLRSEPSIVSGLARAVLGERTTVRWEWLVEDYDRIRERIEQVVPGFEDFNRRVREHGGFVLPVGPRERQFGTPSKKALFSVLALPRQEVPPGRFLLMTIRSHDQFNTTVYGLEDRYRGVSGSRRVVFLHPEDMKDAGLLEGQVVTLTSHFEGESRVANEFHVKPYDIPRRCAAAYFPEANCLVPVRSVAEKSETPTYKSIVVSIAPALSPERAPEGR